MEDEKPNIITPSTKPHKPGGLKGYYSGKNLVKSIAILLTVLAVVAGIILITNQQKQAAKYEFTYKNSQTYKVPGTQPGRGMSFNKPSAYTLIIGGEDTNTLRGFIQPYMDKEYKEEQVIALSRLRAQTRDFPKELSPKFMKLISDNMKKPDGSKDYETITLGVKAFASNALQQPGVKMNFGYAQEFTNKSIIANAWQFDVNVNFDKKGPQKTHKGKLLYMFGKQSVYYFLITAVESNWETNKQFFQGIIDSIKIDQ